MSPQSCSKPAGETDITNLKTVRLPVHKVKTHTKVDQHSSQPNPQSPCTHCAIFLECHVQHNPAFHGWKRQGELSQLLWPELCRNKHVRQIACYVIALLQQLVTTGLQVDQHDSQTQPARTPWLFWIGACVHKQRVLWAED